MTQQIYRRFDPWRTAPVQEIDRKEVLASHYFSVDQVTYASAQNKQFTRTMLNESTGDTIAVLAMTDEGTIALIEQYRLPTHRWTLELPAGHPRDSSERPLEVAQRKLREEAGYEARSFTQFERFINTPSFSNQHTALFYAQDLTQVERGKLGPETPHHDVRLVSIDEAYDMVIAGTILDAKTVIAILRTKAGFGDLERS
ncbi:ADP-ribose pyrophosphatase [Bombiscardovia apis]|uniref:ADP-ribose pyrophosphatase n=1 Tax=Bombiscardovia apis TaxID=2932182 RepID=A0ABN6SEL2_9BIFI|nr:NUDIX hydrolase [Bombiscardovia apis]BDR54480.1 ADP-ribose pyrophosphatase [Bombiscardovia apis]